MGSQATMARAVATQRLENLGLGLSQKWADLQYFFRVYYHDVSYFPLLQCCFFLNDLRLSTRPIYVFDVHAKFRVEWWNAISVKTTSFLETRRQWLFKRTHVLYFLVNFLGNKMRERTPGRN